MNKQYKKESLKQNKLPLRIDSFHNCLNDRFIIEYDGWHFEGNNEKAVINKVLKYIFNGGNNEI